MDLVHLSRYNKTSQREEGHYHFVTGVDLSSHVAPQAYVHMLSLAVDLSAKHPAIFTYCAFNCFSRCDVRLRVEMPSGALQLVALPADRAQKPPELNEQLWDELYVSSVVRAVIVGLDRERKLPSLVEKSLFQSKQQTGDLIARVVKFIPRGLLLGASPLVQKPSLHENHLVDVLCFLAQVSGQFHRAIHELQQLPLDLTPIIARLLCLMDNEIDAVRYLYRAIQRNPRDPLLLNEQALFLIKKGKPDLALQCALQSVKANPLSFQSWYWLSMAYLLNNDIHSALVSLNSAPMYAQRQKDLVVLDTKDSLHLIEPQTGKVRAVWDSAVFVFGPNPDNMLNFTPRFEVESVDPALKRVNTQLWKGTYKKACELLILMCSKVEWEGLLRARADVFIMDEEYKASTATLHSQGMKEKRQCERWLDNLFLTVYDDLRITLIVENELGAAKQLRHSALEWELIGLTAYRTGHYKSVVPALRTALIARFDILAAMKLLKIWDLHVLSRPSNRAQWVKDSTIDMTLDNVLEILLSVVSYDVKFSNEAHTEVLLFVKRLCDRFDTDLIKNKVQVLFENDNDDEFNSGVIPPFDKLVDMLNNV